MIPKLWGPYAWHLLHTVAFTASDPSANHNVYDLFYESLITVLPCQQCQGHYTEFLEGGHPVITNSPSGLIKWVNTLHNHVNELKNVPKWKPEQVKQLYYNKDGSVNINHAKIFKFIDIVVSESAENYSNIDKFQDYIIFFNSLRTVFPCPVCRETLSSLMNKYEFDNNVFDAESLKAWYEKIESEWKKEHLYLNTDVFLLYQKNKTDNDKDKEWFTRHINTLNVKYIEKVGKTFHVIHNDGKSTVLSLPSDIDRSKMKIITSIDLEFAKGILELQKQNSALL